MARPSLAMTEGKASLNPNPSYHLRPRLCAVVLVDHALQHGGHAFQGGSHFSGFEDECDTNVTLARIDAVRIGARHVAAGQHPDRRLGPQSLRRRFAVADIEPQEEAALRAHLTEDVFQRVL